MLPLFLNKKKRVYQCIPIFGHFLMLAREFDDLVCHLPLFISDQCTTYTSRVDIKRVAPSWFELWESQQAVAATIERSVQGLQ